MTTKEAMDTMRSSFQSDSMYAWTWHCTIAMAIHDEGVDISTANNAANRIMKNCFGVETKEPT